jgi:hypothetical protein
MKLNTRNLSRRNREAGLTLIELVVVLTVLTALGGILVPVIGNMISRTHFAKCAVTIPDITRSLARSFASDLRYPDQWDSLVADDGGLFSKLPGGDAGGDLSIATLSAEQVGGLAALGIESVVDLDNTIDGDATWDVAELGKELRPLVEGGEVVVLLPGGASAKSLNLKRHDVDGTTQYVVFGIGNNCTAVGPTGLFVESPTHFGGEDAMNPRDVYQRYAAIFSMNGAGDVNFECAASIHPDGLDGAEAHIRGYYDETAD